MPESKRANQPTTTMKMSTATTSVRILRLISFSHLRFTHKYNARSLPSNINASYMCAQARAAWVEMSDAGAAIGIFKARGEHLFWSPFSTRPFGLFVCMAAPWGSSCGIYLIPTLSKCGDSWCLVFGDNWIEHWTVIMEPARALGNCPICLYGCRGPGDAQCVECRRSSQ